jgi:hypothetical protein
MFEIGSLQEMGQPELVVIAKSLKIKGTPKLDKAALIDAILTTQPAKPVKETPTVDEKECLWRKKRE